MLYWSAELPVRIGVARWFVSGRGERLSGLKPRVPILDWSAELPVRIGVARWFVSGIPNGEAG
jgi:hypothetical protein